MDRAPGGKQARVRAGERALLGYDEGVRHPVERVVPEQAKRKGAPDSLVVGGQVAHAVAHAHEGAGDAAVLEVARKRVADGGTRGQGGEAGDKGVGTLVGKKEGEQLLLAVDDTLGQARHDVLTEDVVRDDCGHACSSRRFL